jgi:2'-5' RNA ligase
MVIAYWLIPAEPTRTFFRGLINDLARRHNASAFEPHLTVHVQTDHEDIAESVISKAAGSCNAIKLKTLAIGESSEFIKTLFVNFAFNAELRRLSETIRNAAEDSSCYKLKPHLSLLYKKMPTAARRELASSIKVPFSEIIFESLKAVRCVSPTQSSADVEAWRIVAAKAFGPIRFDAGRH